MGFSVSKKRTYIYVTGKEYPYSNVLGIDFIQGGIKHESYAHKIAKEDKLTVYKLIKVKSYEKN